MKIPNKRDLQHIASNHLSDIKFKDFTKFYKDYTREPFSFLLKNTTLESTYHKITVSEKIRIIDNKIEQNKPQYNLDEQTDALPEKGLLEKAATI